jgi:nucleotide-binding universal stress UspA family protein
MKILIAVDNSEGSLRAVDFVGQHFVGMGDLSITLFHVLPPMPITFWDEGHFLTIEEDKARKEMIEKWLETEKQKIEPLLSTQVKKLVQKGMNQEKIETRTISGPSDVADSILDEARAGGYQLLVVGRHGFSKAERFVMGGVSNKIVSRGAGMAVCIVE